MSFLPIETRAIMYKIGGQNMSFLPIEIQE